MTAPSQPNDPNAGGQVRPPGAEIPEAEYGSTAQFQAFVRENDDPDEARDRAAADPDGARPALDVMPDDREIQFSEPPPVRSAQPTPRPATADVEDAELGSTAQFQAFAAGPDDDTIQSAASERRTTTDDDQVLEAVVPEDHDPTAAQIMDDPQVRGSVQPSDLPPVNPDNKRNLYIALAVIVLVAVVVALIYFIA
ncbi:hypothetical protein [Blastococcus sp. Marseille-P5729]|uniref:hypothetical protein n=1 Tax=Blastococcus sp. Marseille-P5729 TaxID=2086582 RepID=UPI000D10A4C4|nr:hypothetical protein [Blastococcus sp. Marseille-P5729]